MVDKNMNDYPYSQYVTFILETPEDRENPLEEVQFYNFPHVPNVNEVVYLASTRDSKGNYKYDSPRMRFKGIVTRIDRFIEERGADFRDWRLIHNINVYLTKLEEDEDDN